MFVVKSKPSTLKKNKNQSVWQTTGTRSSKFFKLVRTRDKKILVFSDLGLDNQGPDLVDISQKIGHKRHRIGSPCEVPSAFNVFNHSPIQEPPRRASSLHYLINCHPLFLASEKRQYLLAAKGCVGKSVILHKIAMLRQCLKHGI